MQTAAPVTQPVAEAAEPVTEALLGPADLGLPGGSSLPVPFG
jgi:hypothetical protein